MRPIHGIDLTLETHDIRLLDIYCAAFQNLSWSISINKRLTLYVKLKSRRIHQIVEQLMSMLHFAAKACLVSSRKASLLLRINPGADGRPGLSVDGLRKAQKVVGVQSV
ncbi:hypothetical protein CCR75_004071 [Bremia lactucae]|uniref:Uncharacterized protein n=1 Tax=Bremia lactucae TaxID=4779 RepID=A0A976IJ84_BRELC|nr:hypothetical protein CCR75_004071 [Bremia lactucae]